MIDIIQLFRILKLRFSRIMISHLYFLIYLLFTADIPTIDQTFLISFADDT